MEFNKEISDLIEVIKLSPDNLPLKKMYYEALIKNGFNKKTSDELKDDINKFPNDLDLRFLAVRAYYNSDEFNKCVLILDFILSKDENYSKAYVLYSKILYKKGEFENAIDFYKEGINKDLDLIDSEFEGILFPELDKKEKLLLYNNVEDENIEDDLDFNFQDEKDDLILNSSMEKLSFEDVGGMDSIKEDIRLKIIYPLKNSKIYEAYGKKAGGGILLYGPPGCGKTYIAKAVAGEVDASFIHISISDILDKYIGEAEKRLSDIFDLARRKSPCVLYFDEMDALAGKRSDLSGSSKHLVNQFLSELDGATKSNDGLLFIGSTNSPWYIDTAFRRPGRFEKVAFVSPPDKEARKAILKIKLKGKPVGEINLNKIADKTDGFSGADLTYLIDNAIEEKIKKSLQTGEIEGLKTSDLLNSLKVVNKTTDEWFSDAKNYAIYSNISGVYDDILKYLKLG